MNAVSSVKSQPSHPDFQVAPDGIFSCSGGGAALLHTLGAKLRAAALRAGAEEHSFPTVISEQTLQCAEYFQSFPQYASRVDAPKRAESYFLSPAVCYHCYQVLAHSQLSDDAMMTCCGRCFRGDTPDSSHLWEFTMRELVFVGSSEFVREQRENWMQKVCGWSRQLGLQAELVPAEDPFFAAENRGKKLLQQLKQLKFELETTGGGDMAIASFNLHEQFFGQRFDITLRNDGPAFSACVAFGLERWVMALLARYDAAESLERLEVLQ